MKSQEFLTEAVTTHEATPGMKILKDKMQHKVSESNDGWHLYTLAKELAANDGIDYDNETSQLVKDQYVELAAKELGMEYKGNNTWGKIGETNDLDDIKQLSGL